LSIEKLKVTLFHCSFGLITQKNMPLIITIRMLEQMNSKHTNSGSAMKIMLEEEITTMPDP